MASFFSGVLRFRLLILAVAVGVMAVGVTQLRSAPVDVLPEFTPPYAEIQTEALGLSAEEVEQLITVPMEADLLNGVEGVETIRSESVPGLSSIVLVFARGTDVYRARQLVEERLTQAHALPNVSKPPTLLQPLSSSNRVLMIGLSSSELSLIEQSVIARWTVRPQLMGVEGVANVSVWGMRDQQLQVQVDPARLRAQRVTLSQVVETAGNAQVVSPLTFLEASTPGTGGFIETPQQRLQVRHLLEKIADPAELAKVPVEGTNGRLTLGDVADVKVDHQPLIGDAVVSGGQGLFLVVEKFPGVSSTEVTEDVEEALETLRPGLSGISTGTTVFRPADYVADALRNLGLALLVGGLLMLLAFVAFGFHWRALVAAAVTVPLSRRHRRSRHDPAGARPQRVAAGRSGRGRGRRGGRGGRAHRAGARRDAPERFGRRSAGRRRRRGGGVGGHPSHLDVRQCRRGPGHRSAGRARGPAGRLLLFAGTGLRPRRRRRLLGRGHRRAGAERGVVRSLEARRGPRMVLVAPARCRVRGRAEPHRPTASGRFSSWPAGWCWWLSCWRRSCDPP